MGNSFGRTTDTRATGADSADDTREVPAGVNPGVVIPEQRSAPPQHAAAPATEAPAGGTPTTGTPTTGTPATGAPTGVHYCRCGHDADAHEHFRAGSECAGCGCDRYRTTSGLAALLAFATRRGR